MANDKNGIFIDTIIDDYNPKLLLIPSLYYEELPTLQEFINNIKECQKGNKSYNDYRVLLEAYSPNMYKVFIPSASGKSELTQLLIERADVSDKYDLQNEVCDRVKEIYNLDLTYREIENHDDPNIRNIIYEVKDEEVFQLYEDLLMLDETNDYEEYEEAIIRQSNECYLVKGTGFNKPQSVVTDLFYLYKVFFDEEIPFDIHVSIDVKDAKNPYNYFFK